MGREVKRVPLDFDWPVKKDWWGFHLPAVPCQSCQGSGKRPGAGSCLSIWGHESRWCDVCEGEGKVYPQIPVPEGRPGKDHAGLGWQMWQNTSEGSPISPVFATPEELAHWLADTKASAFGGQGASYEHWLGMIHAGSAPSFAIKENQLMSGVELVATPRTD